MVDWIPVLLLPNVELKDPIECEQMTLMGLEGERVRELASRHPTFAKLTANFTDAFGLTVRPAVLLVNSKAPKQVFHIHAIASFRDVMAASTIPYNRAQWLRYRNYPRVAYSNSFALYPWSLSK